MSNATSTFELPHKAPGAFRILALGDCVGRPGRNALKEALPRLRPLWALDFIVANVENATNGWGLRPKEADDILTSGVDMMTNGDHIRDRREIDPYLREQPNLLRPIDYDHMPGVGAKIVEVEHEGKTLKIGIGNFCGRTFMPEIEDSSQHPGVLALADRVMQELEGADLTLVDVHAEASAEKVAVGWHLDGRASVVWGTHTHVQTADEQVLPEGTGYITDLGFVGGHKSVLGRQVEKVLAHMQNVPKSYMEVSKEWPQLDGAIFDLDPGSGRCIAVTRVQHRLSQ